MTIHRFTVLGSSRLERPSMPGTPVESRYRHAGSLASRRTTRGAASLALRGGWVDVDSSGNQIVATSPNLIGPRLCCSTPREARCKRCQVWSRLELSALFATQSGRQQWRFTSRTADRETLEVPFDFPSLTQQLASDATLYTRSRLLDSSGRAIRRHLGRRRGHPTGDRGEALRCRAKATLRIARGALGRSSLPPR